jgi:hypothetical protein
MSFRRARWFNSAVAIVAALAWFTATHHCLLGVMNEGQGTVASACGCSDHCKGSGQNNQPSLMLACCQGLLSPALELAQANVKFSPVLLGLQLTAVAQLGNPEAFETVSVGTEYDTGPPRENCFLETVLKRSLPENAPPFFT